MEKIKEVFKPDVQKEAEAARAAEAGDSSSKPFYHDDPVAPNTTHGDVTSGAGTTTGTAAVGSIHDTTTATPTAAYDQAKHEHHVARDQKFREQTGGGAFGFLHKHQEPKYQDPSEPETTAKEKYYGTDSATHHVSPTVTREERVVPSSTGQVNTASAAVGNITTTDANLAGGAAAGTAAAGTVPRGSVASTGSNIAHVPAAHETFVQPGYHHDRHIGVDGPIGRTAEISGLQGTDARRTSTVAEVGQNLDPSNVELARPQDRKPSLVEQEATLGEGRVIEPTTGLPMNVGKYGTGHGGTDGSAQIHGFEQATHAQRLQEADERNVANKEIGWDKIAESNETSY